MAQKRTRQESVSLDPEDLEAVIELAAQMAVSRSAVVRVLVREALKARAAQQAAQSPYSPVIGGFLHPQE